MKRHYKNGKPSDTNGKPIDASSHKTTDPLLTELQEIIFDLYDEENFEFARRLEDFEISFLKYFENNS